MIEAYGNLWHWDADYRCITTNGYVKKNGEAVMGRGCAREAAKKWPELPEILGDMLRSDGNHVHELGYGIDRNGKYVSCAWEVLSFPVKHHWRDKASLELIERSAQELVEFVDGHDDDWDIDVVLPRPGCGNGQLAWEQVKPILEPILDDRFQVITFRPRS